MLNQIVPSGVRVMPWLCAARPLLAAMNMGFTSPVLVSTLPIEVRLFGILQVNQTLPASSSHASCTPQPGINVDGVPSDQSEPSFCTKFAGSPASGSSGRSYSRISTRAGSPLGRGSSGTFTLLCGPRARARYAASSFWW